MDRSMKHPVDEGPSTLWHSAKNSAKAGVRDMRGAVNKVLHPILVSVPCDSCQTLSSTQPNSRAYRVSNRIELFFSQVFALVLLATYSSITFLCQRTKNGDGSLEASEGLLSQPGRGVAEDCDIEYEALHVRGAEPSPIRGVRGGEHAMIIHKDETDAGDAHHDGCVSNTLDSRFE